MEVGALNLRQYELSRKTVVGMIAALIAQGLSSQDAAVLGVYLHGLAGDGVAEERPAGMTAVDLAERIPATIRSLMV